jgi:hypothetical protein
MHTLTQQQIAVLKSEKSELEILEQEMKQAQDGNERQLKIVAAQIAEVESQLKRLLEQEAAGTNEVEPIKTVDLSRQTA